ncbi:cytochrome d ubiquinol oxidase subunit II [Actinocrispum wychmicini]|uniref:Cytochrome d ubiquinol oxidase subunit II n=1 Tax=Actinocrispum wychmicini TaxID=1213861 RepID=A0A4V2S7Z9_9PSEU|nr:cytochrome d ubiquinol oxidase subunit II [Actinocrispum wychmicini]TCO61960.1 cytochrome d ubiquinol oxidase subunit II [Actinocrispum wychmicini]
MALTDIWFVLIAVLWTGYFVLEGFDFGVGMLLRVLSKDDTDRRVLINTIGPVWDGNEVWLLVAGGATFAAFPLWYASLFSGFYLALLVILVALIIRGVAFEFRGKIDSVRWRRNWDRAIMVGSTVPALLWGVAFGNIVHGVPLDAQHHFTGTFFILLNPYALLGGLATLTVFMLHGCVFLALKTTDTVRDHAIALAKPLGSAAILCAGGFLAWTAADHGGWAWLFAIAAAVALVLGVSYAIAGREGVAFVCTAVAIVATTVTLFAALYPNVLPSTTDIANSLTTTNASSTPYTLRIMTWVAVAFTPIVLVYQGWTYWVFRKRVTRASIPSGQR